MQVMLTKGVSMLFVYLLSDHFECVSGICRQFFVDICQALFQLSVALLYVADELFRFIDEVLVIDAYIILSQAELLHEAPVFGMIFQ
jgi:hypothetical protein